MTNATASLPTWPSGLRQMHKVEPTSFTPDGDMIVITDRVANTPENRNRIWDHASCPTLALPALTHGATQASKETFTGTGADAGTTAKAAGGRKASGPVGAGLVSQTSSNRGGRKTAGNGARAGAGAAKAETTTEPAREAQAA